MLIGEQFNRLYLLVKKTEVENTRVIIYYVLEQSKEKTLQFSKGAKKGL